MLTREEFQPIYDQGFEAVWTVIEALQKAVLTQQAQIETLTARVKELEDRLGKDSHNSNKPPSSDGYKKKPVSLREQTGRKTGGQQGHTGKTLSFSERPDVRVLHTPIACRACGHSLKETSATEGERRQVLDLPPLALITTEHCALHKTCPHCGTQSVGTFPPEVATGVSYGTQIKALALYLKNFQLLPTARIVTLLSDLFGTSFSEGTLFPTEQRASERLEPFLERVRSALLASPVLHCDETGLRVEAKLHWLHSASTEEFTLYGWHPKRGKAGIDHLGLLPRYSGVAVHDGWASYESYSCSHGLCNAHHLRELVSLYEQGGQIWAREMSLLLVAMKRAVETAKGQGLSCLPKEEQETFLLRYASLLAKGFATNPISLGTGKRGKVKQSSGYNLLRRLSVGQESVLRFSVDFSVPFDNNLAERDLRMMKLQQKVSGSFRTVAGATAFCRIRSYISTLRKQGYSVLPALQQLLIGKPLIPET
jgi:transposase